jgi:hypothetical protein
VRTIRYAACTDDGPRRLLRSESKTSPTSVITIEDLFCKPKGSACRPYHLIACQSASYGTFQYAAKRSAFEFKYCTRGAIRAQIAADTATHPPWQLELGIHCHSRLPSQGNNLADKYDRRYFSKVRAGSPLSTGGRVPRRRKG